MSDEYLYNLLFFFVSSCKFDLKYIVYFFSCKCKNENKIYIVKEEEEEEKEK